VFSLATRRSHNPASGQQVGGNRQPAQTGGEDLPLADHRLPPDRHKIHQGRAALGEAQTGSVQTAFAGPRARRAAISPDPKPATTMPSARAGAGLPSTVVTVWVA